MSLGKASVLFMSGAMLWGWKCSWVKRAAVRYCDVAGMLIVLLVLWFANSLGNYAASVGLTVGFCVLLLGLSQDKGIITRFLAQPIAVYLGELSYSLYLTHGMVHKVIKDVLPASRFADASVFLRAAIFFSYAALISLAAVILYHFIERPARSWLRYLAERSQTISPGRKPAL